MSRSRFQYGYKSLISIKASSTFLFQNFAQTGADTEIRSYLNTCLTGMLNGRFLFAYKTTKSIVPAVEAVLFIGILE